MSDKRRDLIAKVLATNTDEHSTDDERAAAIADALAIQDDIRKRLRRVRDERSDIEAEYKADLIRLDQERDEIRRSCPHFTSTYHGDPSGGRDSWTECDDCGAEL